MGGRGLVCRRRVVELVKPFVIGRLRECDCEKAPRFRVGQEKDPTLVACIFIEVLWIPGSPASLTEPRLVGQDREIRVRLCGVAGIFDLATSPSIARSFDGDALTTVM